ncbi:MAG: hypothetical protein C0614_12555 [Desulfuromonas sp.]|nr:MAG: hypothetical protein C0614_12555 [Desulfuromonas sp.]
MTEPISPRSNVLPKLVVFNLGLGLTLSFVILAAASLTLGRSAWSPSFIAACLLCGLMFGSTAFWSAHQILKKQLHHQLTDLLLLTGEQPQPVADLNVSALDAKFHQALVQLSALLVDLGNTVNLFVPHYMALADASRFLSARSEDGLQAARTARGDVEDIYQKQKAVMGEVENLTNRLQDEASLSRELSTSLEEMAGAIEHSTRKFHETSDNVTQMVHTIQTTTAESERVAETMERTAHDLDGIGEALQALREGAARSAENAEEVKQDAQQGVGLVTGFVTEMGRIDQESQKSITAMQRLALQTVEVTRIIEVIKEMVSDTELLAFNAAIIAAKAGVEGRGFSVVAEEIRDLADRTAASAGEIEGLVKTIQKDAQQVNLTVESTGRFIGRGLELSQLTGDSLRKIAASSNEAASTSQGLTEKADEQEQRARELINEAGRNLRSIRDISLSMGRLETSVGQIHAGVTEMKGAADQISRGFDEQVKANNEFDRGLANREDQVNAIFEATRSQMEKAGRVFEHFGRSEQRLIGNAEKASVINRELVALEELAGRLRQLTASALADSADSADESG